MRVSGVAEDDPAAGYAADHVSLDGVVLASVFEHQAGRAQPGERVAGEGDVVRGAPLDAAGFAGQRPERAGAGGRAECTGRLWMYRIVAGQAQVVLHVGETHIGAR